MAIYILAFILASFIYVTFTLLKINKRLKEYNKVLQDNNMTLQTIIESREYFIKNLYKLTSKQAVEITKLQTKLDIYNE